MSGSAPGRKVAVSFMAHPDDAEILCAGTLLRLADAGWEVHVVTTTPGDCGSATLPPEEISAIRREEGKAAAAVIGGTYHCLEERDLNVMFNPDTNRKTIDLFRRLAPTLVFTHPRYDYMVDHEQVHLLARSATFSYAIPNASKLPLVPGSVVPHLYYSDPVEALDPYTGKTVTPTTLVDITEQIDRKAEALAAHASQREWLRSHHGMDEYIEAMKRDDEMRGKQKGTRYAEAFVQHAGHAYPHDDLLMKLFG